MRLEERVVELHRALDRAGIPHAIGGAIALAYSTLSPRGTKDIDVNVFVPAEDPGKALAALPAEIEQPAETEARIKRDGQVRLWWERTPIDLFFNNLPIHDRAARNVERVDFQGVQIPILGPLELAVFKAMFDRAQDWADISAMLVAETLDVTALRATLTELVGPGDRRLSRLDEAVRDADKGPREDAP